MRRVAKANAGFSLLELTTAIFVVTAGIFGIITLLQQGLGHIRTVQEYRIAEQAVVNEVEVLRARIESLADGTAIITGAQGFRSASAALEKLHNAVPQSFVTERSDLAPNLYEVTARLAWSGDRGRTIQKSLTTLVTPKGIAP